MLVKFSGIFLHRHLREARLREILRSDLPFGQESRPALDRVVWAVGPLLESVGDDETVGVCRQRQALQLELRRLVSQDRLLQAVLARLVRRGQQQRLVEEDPEGQLAGGHVHVALRRSAGLRARIRRPQAHRHFGAGDERAVRQVEAHVHQLPAVRAVRARVEAGADARPRLLLPRQLAPALQLHRLQIVPAPE